MTPYEEGVETFKNGLLSFDNPYNERTPEFTQWENGWIRSNNP